MNDFISGNFTQVLEATKMPTSILAGMLVLLIGIFIYLWMEAGKKDKDITEIKKDITGIKDDIDKIKNVLNIKDDKGIAGGGQNVGNQSNPTEPKHKNSDKPTRHNRH
jgi:hypothetical protein